MRASEQRLMQWASQHHGLVTSTAARAHGLDDAAVRRRLRSGAWVPVGRALYRVAAAPPTDQSALLAAVWSGGEHAWASGTSAAALYGIPGFDLLPPSLLTLHNGPRRPGTQLRRCDTIPDHHVTTVDSIPCTSPSRTIFELFATVHERRAERAGDTALVRNVVSARGLWVILLDLAARGRNGTATCRDFLMARSDGRALVESELEGAFLRLCRRFGLPEPERQITFGDGDGIIGRVDFFFRRWKLVVECDGRLWHNAKLDVDRDRARDERLRAMGLTVVRLTWHDIVHDDGATNLRLRSYLA